jgi:hypothetical protein
MLEEERDGYCSCCLLRLFSCSSSSTLSVYSEVEETLKGAWICFFFFFFFFFNRRLEDWHATGSEIIELGRALCT